MTADTGPELPCRLSELPRPKSSWMPNGERCGKLCEEWFCGRLRAPGAVTWMVVSGRGIVAVSRFMIIEEDALRWTSMESAGSELESFPGLLGIAFLYAHYGHSLQAHHLRILLVAVKRKLHKGTHVHGRKRTLCFTQSYFLCTTRTLLPPFYI